MIDMNILASHILTLHILVLLFFILLILYSLTMNDTIEGLEGGCSIDPQTTSNDINEINQKLVVLKDIKSRVDTVETKSKQNIEGLKKISDELAKAGSDSLGGFKEDTNISGLE